MLYGSTLRSVAGDIAEKGSAPLLGENHRERNENTITLWTGLDDACKALKCGSQEDMPDEMTMTLRGDGKFEDEAFWTVDLLILQVCFSFALRNRSYRGIEHHQMRRKKVSN